MRSLTYNYIFISLIIPLRYSADILEKFKCLAIKVPRLLVNLIEFTAFGKLLLPF